MEHPLCAFCAEWGIVMPAVIVDHVEPHRGDINKFWLGPLQSLCQNCHVKTKHQIELWGYRTDIGLNGYPTDKNHPFYQNAESTPAQGGVISPPVRGRK